MTVQRCDRVADVLDRPQRRQDIAGLRHRPVLAQLAVALERFGEKEARALENAAWLKEAGFDRGLRKFEPVTLPVKKNRIEAERRPDPRIEADFPLRRVIGLLEKLNIQRRLFGNRDDSLDRKSVV